MDWKAPAARVAPVAAFLALALAVAPVALAGKGKPGGGAGSTCTQNAPSVLVQNNWEWGASGSWGLPGQQLTYDIEVVNNDVGCGSSSFVLSVSAPSGFSVSIPTSTVSLNSSSAAYLLVYVTSPNVVADGDYTLTATAQRTAAVSAAAASGSAATYYKVYSSDTTAPTLFWPNPGEGTTISSSHSYSVTVSSSDDHAVKKIDLYIDGAYVATKACDDITYICQLNYGWPTRSGQHTATFKSYDWMGNVGVTTVSFTVS